MAPAINGFAKLVPCIFTVLIILSESNDIPKVEQTKVAKSETDFIPKNPFAREPYRLIFDFLATVKFNDALVYQQK